MEDGVAGDSRVLQAMRSVCSAVVTSTASATVAALAALDLRRIALFSPYVAATHAHEMQFLTEVGLAVVGGRSLGLPGGDEYIRVLPSEWLELAVRETPASADGVFLSCTNIRAVEVIDALEERLQRPVITSNQAVLWHALRLCGRSDVVPGLGRLLGVTAAAVA
jgi:maleate cis-trans isomerase